MEEGKPSEAKPFHLDGVQQEISDYYETAKKLRGYAREMDSSQILQFHVASCHQRKGLLAAATPLAAYY